MNVDDLPPVQYLVLDSLAGRLRCGEPCWTFPRRLKPHLNALAASGLIERRPAIHFVRTVAATLLIVTSELAARAASVIAPAGYDAQGAHLVQRPKVGRWVLVAEPHDPHRRVRLIARYRSKWVAGWVARRAPRILHGNADYRIYRAAHFDAMNVARSVMGADDA